MTGTKAWVKEWTVCDTRVWALEALNCGVSKLCHVEMLNAELTVLVEGQDKVYGGNKHLESPSTLVDTGASGLMFSEERRQNIIHQEGKILGPLGKDGSNQKKEMQHVEGKADLRA